MYVWLFQVRIEMRRYEVKSTCCQPCLIFGVALPHLSLLISDVWPFRYTGTAADQNAELS